VVYEKTGEQNSRPHGKQPGYLTASMECSIERPMPYSQQLASRFENQTERYGAAEGKSARRRLLLYRSGILRYVCSPGWPGSFILSLAEGLKDRGRRR
jgi:hypothetical protein